jgi:DNA uptake protein ComE-like DNA-binding protein
MKNFLYGLGAGIGIGVLLAPRAGEETRQRLGQRARDMAEGVGDTSRRWAEKVPGGTRAYEAVSNVASQTTERARDLVGTAREQAGRVMPGVGGGGVVQALNSVSREDLISVPGIGPVLADRILQGRPYRSENDLVEQNILSDSLFQQLKRQVLQKKTA